MALRDLHQLGLILPEEHWGSVPSASLRTAILTTLAALLGLISALLVWFGAGGSWTFVGIGLFFLDLLAFLLVTFRAVEDRMEQLETIGADGATAPGSPQRT